MLLHLPIVMLATLSPVAVSDTVPKFDIARECRFEGGSATEFGRCTDDEGDALQDLQKTWTQFASADRRNCVVETMASGFASYVELLTCLELARDARNTDENSRGSQSAEQTSSSRR
jgi:hypothetical protein